MRTVLYVLGVAGLAAGLHVLIGWPATALAGAVAAGARFPIATGALGVGLAWFGGVAYSFVVSDVSTLRLLTFLADAMGGVPQAVLIALPAVVGAVWGGAAAAVVAGLRKWMEA